MTDSGSKIWGVLLAFTASASFGLIPLFTVPLLKAGVPAQTAAFYRFGLAAVMLWPVLLLAKEKIFAPFSDIFRLAVLSLFYFLDVILFFHAFNYLPSGIVATLEFLFPVMVMVIMVVFFKETFHWQAAVAIFIAVAGVAMLSNAPGADSSLSGLPDGENIFLGTLLSLCAAFFNALYIAGFQVCRIKSLTPLAITFYVMLFGALFSLGNAFFGDALRWLDTWPEFSLAFLLALITAVISNLTLVMAIRRIGATLASILGVLEPLAAVGVGVFAFNERFSLSMALGAFLIICAVIIVVAFPHSGNCEK